MSEAKFTKGPWSHSYRKGHDGMNRHEVYDQNGETIATLAWYPVKVDANTTRTNRAENACLIAAAPDLLAALRHFVAVSQSPASHDKDFDKAEEMALAAIAKATEAQ